MLRAVLVLVPALFASSLALAAEPTPIVVAAGVNRSFDQSLATLSYAETDAERFTHTMQTVGRVEMRNTLLLRGPTAEEFVAAVRSQARAAPKARVILFFSGHADERGLHFRGGPLSRTELHKLLGDLPAATKVVFIDSCFAGAIARKGVVADQPFDLPKLDMDQLTGSVFLTASAASEVAYESEQLSGSVFTHHIVAGLNGASDANTDGLVTVDELYQYVYRETKLRSLTYPGATVQRPEYHAELHGQGALVLSQPSHGLGVVRLDPGIMGSVHLRSTSGLGSFTLHGDGAKVAEYKVPEGAYRALIRRGDRVGEAGIVVARHEPSELRAGQFTWATVDMMPPTAAKGYVSNAATTSIGIASVRRAVGKTQLQAFQGELGWALVDMVTAGTKLTIMSNVALYGQEGYDESSHLQSMGASWTVGFLGRASGSAMKMLGGLGMAREFQSWNTEDYLGDTRQVTRWTMAPTVYTGLLFPIGQGPSGHWSLALKYEFGSVADRRNDATKIDMTTVGIAVER